MSIGINYACGSRLSYVLRWHFYRRVIFQSLGSSRPPSLTEPREAAAVGEECPLVFYRQLSLNRWWIRQSHDPRSCRCWSATAYYAPPLEQGALSDDACLTSDVCLSVCLSVAYIGPKSRSERPRKTKIVIEVAHVTRNSDTTFKVKRSKVNLQGREHIVAASRTACSLCQKTCLLQQATGGRSPVRHQGTRPVACSALPRVERMHVVNIFWQ